MERREELLKLVDDSNSAVVVPLIDKMLFLENQIENLEKLPMIRVNPENSEQQKSTPAAKLYKEFLQQYTNIVKIIACMTNDDNSAADDSPLRKWVNERLKC